MKNLFKEPLVHFLIIGAGLFLLFGLFNNPAESESGRIVISTGQIDYLKANFTRTWQRSPTEKELQGLIDSYVRDEIFYREASAMGLDRDDSGVGTASCRPERQTAWRPGVATGPPFPPVSTGSVVVPSLHEVYPAFRNTIHNTVLLGKSA